MFFCNKIKEEVLVGEDEGHQEDAQTKRDRIEKGCGWSWDAVGEYEEKKSTSRQMENNRTTHSHTRTQTPQDLHAHVAARTEFPRLFTIFPPCSSMSWWSATVALEWYSWSGLSVLIHTHCMCTLQACTHTHKAPAHTLCATWSPLCCGDPVAASSPQHGGAAPEPTWV